MPYCLWLGTQGRSSGRRNGMMPRRRREGSCVYLLARDACWPGQGHARSSLIVAFYWIARQSPMAIKQELERLARIRPSGGTPPAKPLSARKKRSPALEISSAVSCACRRRSWAVDSRLSDCLPPDMFGHVFSHRSHVLIEAATPVTVCCYSLASEALIARFPAPEHKNAALYPR